MPRRSVFKELTKYYDLIYSWKDYQKEADKIKSLIKKYKKSDGHDLLEVACGTGKHLAYLKDSFSILATDLNKTMLSIASKNVPDVAFKQADMINLNLNKKFDVILCLFSSIGYVRTYSNLTKTIQNFAKHLKVGGLVIIEPWFTETVYITGLPSMTTYDGERIKISRLCVSEKRGILSVMDMHYLIAEQNQKIKHFVEKHELAMFDVDKVLNIMKKQGLQGVFLKNGLMKDRGLYIGIKKTRTFNEE
ncbi:MAG: class I SAM-dependent methyltransferase [Proteobacteria bacterium]|nr:class I SAM-dependent methyltransferase [Pseudomonadota bacterium]